MATFGVIDADTHVDENEATWKSLEETGSKHVPVSVSADTRAKATTAGRPESQGRAGRGRFRQPMVARREPPATEGNPR